jgi:hypothetical protein
MEIDADGTVTIWTILRVWRLWRFKSHEKHLFAFRSPIYTEQQWGMVSSRVISIRDRRDFIVQENVAELPISPEVRLVGALPAPAGATARKMDDLLKRGERLDRIVFDENGNFGIWTDKHVWSIWQAGGQEHLLCYPRNPPTTAPR